MIKIPSDVEKPILVLNGHGGFRLYDRSFAGNFRRELVNGKKLTMRVDTDRGCLQLRVYRYHRSTAAAPSSSAWTELSACFSMMGRLINRIGGLVSC